MKKIFSNSNCLLILFFLSITNFLFLKFFYPGFFNPISLEGGDAYSYLNFDFNIYNIFSQQRFITIPLFIKFVKIFDNNLIYWSEINFFFYNISIFFLQFSLIKSGFNRIFSIILTASLVGSYPIYWFFIDWSQVVSASLIIFSFSFFFIALTKNSNFFYLLFAIALYLAYGARPSLVLITISFPIIFLFINKNNQLFNLFKVSFYAFSPFLITLIIKFLLTGFIGFVPFNGAHLAAHALQHLDKKDNAKFNNNKFAKSLILRKEKQKYPCNLSIKNINNENLDLYDFVKKCYPITTMTSMLEGIEYLYNKKPFENVNKNIHAWEYLNLSKFMTDIGSHEELNSLLSNFYFDSLDFYQEDILKVSAILFFEQIKLFFLYFKLLILLFLLFILTSLLLIYILKKEKIIKLKNLGELLKISKLENSFVVSQVIYFFVSIFFLSFLHIPKIYVLLPQNILFFPLILTIIYFKLILMIINLLQR